MPMGVGYLIDINFVANVRIVTVSNLLPQLTGLCSGWLVPQSHLHLAWVMWPHLQMVVSDMLQDNDPSDAPSSGSSPPPPSPSSSGIESESEFSGGRVGAVLICILWFGFSC